jgi:hypothetical protein
MNALLTRVPINTRELAHAPRAYRTRIRRPGFFYYDDSADDTDIT